MSREGQVAGVFVTFEGPEGSGKTTQAEMLSSALMRLHPVVVREPGGTALGERIRVLLLESSAGVAAEAEMYLFLAARAELVEKTIKPALKADRIVIADRYHDSTLAYQGGARGVATWWPESFPRPDITFLLELDPALGLERHLTARKPADRLESESIDFHRAVSLAYDRLAMAEPERFAVLDGSLPEDEIHRQVLARVNGLLEAKAVQLRHRTQAGASTSS